jgi:TatD DNase family protein
MKWIDSHCHLADPRLENQTEVLVEKAKGLGIDFFMMGGVDAQDWSRQESLALKSPQNFGLSFGVHPYFVAQNDDEACELELDRLSKKIAEVQNKKQLQLLAIGEIGLDFRPHIMKDSRERPIRMFEAQVELAQFLELPLVLHLVQSFNEALTVLDFFGPVPRGGQAHAFNGSLEMAEHLIRRGFLISVGGAITYEKNQKLRHTVEHMPLEWLILETDSPDQPPQGREKNKNEPSTLMEVALKVAQIRGISAAEILDLSATNFQRIFCR